MFTHSRKCHLIFFTYTFVTYNYPLWLLDMFSYFTWRLYILFSGLSTAVQKKVHALAKQKNCDDLLGWEKSINNHVYWVASSTQDQEEELRGAKWNSLGNHIQGIHSGHSAIFPTCLHGDLQEERAKNWLKPGKCSISASSVLTYPKQEYTMK